MTDDDQLLKRLINNPNAMFTYTGSQVLSIVNNVEELRDRIRTLGEHHERIIKDFADAEADNARLRDANTIQGDQLTSLMQDNVECGNEVARLRALIYEALSLIGQGHEPGEYAESVWVSQIVATLQEADHDSPRPEP